MIWTTDKIEFLKANYETMSKKELATALGFTNAQVRDKISKSKLTLSSRKIQERKYAGLKAYKERVKLTQQEDEFIALNYLKYPLNQLAKIMGRSRSAIDASLERQGLNIPEELIEQRKQAGRFKKGHGTHNKGVKMPDAVYQKVQKTMFKKGENRKNASVTLTDNYVKWVITMHDEEVEEIPQNLINLKRAEILIKRQLKNLNNESK